MVWKSLPCAPDDIGDVFKVVWYAWVVGPLKVIISTLWVTVVLGKTESPIGVVIKSLPCALGIRGTVFNILW